MRDPHKSNKENLLVIHKLSGMFLSVDNLFQLSISFKIAIRLIAVKGGLEDGFCFHEDFAVSAVFMVHSLGIVYYFFVAGGC